MIGARVQDTRSSVVIRPSSNVGTADGRGSRAYMCPRSARRGGAGWSAGEVEGEEEVWGGQEDFLLRFSPSPATGMDPPRVEKQPMVKG